MPLKSCSISARTFLSPPPVRIVAKAINEFAIFVYFFVFMWIFTPSRSASKYDLYDKTSETDNCGQIFLQWMTYLIFHRQQKIISLAIYEPSHEKTCLCHMRTTKAQISQRIRTV